MSEHKIVLCDYWFVWFSSYVILVSRRGCTLLQLADDAKVLFLPWFVFNLRDLSFLCIFRQLALYCCDWLAVQLDLISVFIFWQRQWSCSSLKWKFEKTFCLILLSINFWVGWRDVFITHGIRLLCCFSIFYSSCQHRWRRTNMTTLKNKFFLCVINSLDVSHHSQPLHVQCKVNTFCWLWSCFLVSRGSSKLQLAF